MRRETTYALGWAFVCICCVGICVLLLWRGAPLQTNLLALLPPTERNPTAERAVAALNDAAGNRAIFLIGHADGATAKQAARRFAAALRASGAFQSITAEVPSFDARLLGRPYLDYRFGLLAEADRRSLAGGSVDLEAWLARRLTSPLRLDAAGDLTLDPFGLFDHYLADLPYRHLRLAPEDGMLVAESGESDAARVHVLVTAELPGSAFDDRTQQSVLGAIEQAELELRQAASGVELLRTGAVFYAGAARSAAAREMDWIGLGSLAGITLLLLAVFRSVQPLLLGLMTVGIGLCAATAVALLAHRELHLLTLVFGASLIGEAIDYSIQYFAAHAESGRQGEPQRARLEPRSVLAAVRPGLSFALATSVLGYAALWLMPFPAIDQIALFALTGLAAAYLSVILLLPVMLRQPYRHDITALTVPAGRFVLWWRNRVTRRTAIALALLIVAACVPGWMRLVGDDDVRSMSSRPPHLLEQESKVRALTGFGYGSALFLVEGDTPETVLRGEEALAVRLRELAAKGEISHFHAVSSFVPSAARQTENRALVFRSLLADEARLARALDNAGFPAGTTAALTRAWQAASERTLDPGEWLATPAAAPYRHLWLGATPGGHASIVLPFGRAGMEQLAGAAAGISNVTLVDKVGSVNRLFRDYRIGFSLGLAVAVATVILILSRRYGWAGAAAVILPALLGMAVALGVFGYAGIAATLFSVLALMLVLGVGANYAIFLVEGAGREGTTFIAVLLSAATTLLSFGLLSFSGTPALARFGMTLLLGIGTAVVLAPLALTLGPRR